VFNIHQFSKICQKYIKARFWSNYFCRGYSCWK